MLVQNNKYIILYKCVAILLACLFIINDIALADGSSLAPAVGDPATTGRMQQVMQALYDAHNEGSASIDEIIFSHRNSMASVSKPAGKYKNQSNIIRSATELAMKRIDAEDILPLLEMGTTVFNKYTNRKETGVEIQLCVLKDGEPFPKFEKVREVREHASNKYITIFVTERELELIEKGGEKAQKIVWAIVGRIFHGIRARSHRSDQPLRLFEEINKKIENEVRTQGRIVTTKYKEEFVNLTFPPDLDIWDRDYTAGGKVSRRQIQSKYKNKNAFIRGLFELEMKYYDADHTDFVREEEAGGLKRLDERVSAHGFRREGPRKIVSCILDGSIRPVSQNELDEMGFSRTWGSPLADSLCIEPLNADIFGDFYGPDFAIVAGRNYALDVKIEEILFFLVSSDQKKAFIVEALKRACEQGLLDESRAKIVRSKIYSYSDIEKLSEEELQQLISSGIRKPAKGRAKTSGKSRFKDGKRPVEAGEDNVRRVESIFENRQKRPEPSDIADISIEDIRKGAHNVFGDKLGDINRLLRRFKEGKSAAYMELENALPYVEEIVKEILLHYPDHKILVVGRDAEMIYDALKIVTAGTRYEDNIMLFPVSQPILDYFNPHKGLDVKLAEDFLKTYGLTTDIGEGKQRFLILDSGFVGSIGHTVRCFLDGAYMPSAHAIDGRVDEKIDIKLVGAKSGLIFGKELIKFDIPQDKIYELFPLSATAAFEKTPNMVLACVLQLMPRYHGEYRYLVRTSNGQVIAVPGRETTITKDIDLGRHMKEFNQSIVNPVAAMLFQKRIVDYFQARRNKLLAVTIGTHKRRKRRATSNESTAWGGIGPGNIIEWLKKAETQQKIDELIALCKGDFASGITTPEELGAELFKFAHEEPEYANRAAAVAYGLRKEGAWDIFVYSEEKIIKNKTAIKGLDGYSAMVMENFDPRINETTINAIITRDSDGRYISGAIELNVNHSHRIIVIDSFYPHFPDKSSAEYINGRGRRLLWSVISKYHGYEIIGSAQEPLQKSFKQMTLLNPLTELADKEAFWRKISERMAAFRDGPKDLYDEFRESTIYGIVPPGGSEQDVTPPEGRFGFGSGGPEYNTARDNIVDTLREKQHLLDLDPEELVDIFREALAALAPEDKIGCVMEAMGIVEGDEEPPVMSDEEFASLVKTADPKKTMDTLVVMFRLTDISPTLATIIYDISATAKKYDQDMDDIADWFEADDSKITEYDASKTDQESFKETFAHFNRALTMQDELLSYWQETHPRLIRLLNRLKIKDREDQAYVMEIAQRAYQTFYDQLEHAIKSSDTIGRLMLSLSPLFDDSARSEAINLGQRMVKTFRLALAVENRIRADLKDCSYVAASALPVIPPLDRLIAEHNKAVERYQQEGLQSLEEEPDADMADTNRPSSDADRNIRVVNVKGMDEKELPAVVEEGKINGISYKIHWHNRNGKLFRGDREFIHKNISAFLGNANEVERSFNRIGKEIKYGEITAVEVQYVQSTERMVFKIGFHINGIVCEMAIKSVNGAGRRQLRAFNKLKGTKLVPEFAGETLGVYYEEWINGPTVHQLGARRGLTSAEIKKIASTWTRIGRRLSSGKDYRAYPTDMNPTNILFRSSGDNAGDFVVVDIYKHKDVSTTPLAFINSLMSCYVFGNNRVSVRSQIPNDISSVLFGIYEGFDYNKVQCAEFLNDALYCKSGKHNDQLIKTAISRFINDNLKPQPGTEGGLPNAAYQLKAAQASVQSPGSLPAVGEYGNEAYENIVRSLKGKRIKEPIIDKAQYVREVKDLVYRVRAESKMAGRAFVVAVDGNSGAIKSSSAQEIARMIREAGGKAVVIERDWFIKSRDERYRRQDAELAGAEISLRDDEISLRRGKFEREVLKKLRQFNAGNAESMTLDLKDLYNKKDEGRLTRSERIQIDRDTVVIIEGNYLLKAKWAGYFDIRTLMLAHPSVGLERRLPRDAHTDSIRVTNTFRRINTPSFIHYMRHGMVEPDVIAITDTWKKDNSNEADPIVTPPTISATDKVNVLVLCAYNIERSPLAEQFIRNNLPADLEGKVNVSSSGLFKGKVDEAVMAHLVKNPILRDLYVNKDRQPKLVSEEDVKNADIIYVMSGSQLNTLKSRYPFAEEKIHLLIKGEDLQITDADYPEIGGTYINVEGRIGASLGRIYDDIRNALKKQQAMSPAASLIWENQLPQDKRRSLELRKAMKKIIAKGIRDDYGIAVTPLLKLPGLSRRIGKEIYLKDESVQPEVSSFKIRGVAAEVDDAIEAYIEKVKKDPAFGNEPYHIVTQTSGNHGIAMIRAVEMGIRKFRRIYHDQPQLINALNNIKPKVFTIKTLPVIKKELMVKMLKRYLKLVFDEKDELGGHEFSEFVDDSFSSYEGARRAREELVKSSKGHAVYMEHGGLTIMAGHATAGLEIAQQLSSAGAIKPDTPEKKVVVIVPVGAGGLVGMGEGIKAIYPNAQIVGVPSYVYDAFTRSMLSGQIETNDPDPEPTAILANGRPIVYEDGIAVDKPEKKAIEIARQVLDYSIPVDPKKNFTEAGPLLYSELAKILKDRDPVVGGTTALTLEAILECCKTCEAIRDADVIVLFGSEGNIDPDITEAIKERARAIELEESQRAREQDAAGVSRRDTSLTASSKAMRVAHLDPEQMFEKDEYLVSAINYFNREIIGQSDIGQIPSLTWDKVIDLYEIFRGDRNNPAYNSEERIKRLESVAAHNELLGLANTVSPDATNVLNAAVAVYSYIIDGQIFGWLPGFDRVLDSSKMGGNDSGPASGHHRTAWFAMNYVLIRNGYNPFYFAGQDEYMNIYKDSTWADDEPLSYDFIVKIDKIKLAKMIKERVIDTKTPSPAAPVASAAAPTHNRNNSVEDMMEAADEQEVLIPVIVSAMRKLKNDPFIYKKLAFELAEFMLANPGRNGFVVYGAVSDLHYFEDYDKLMSIFGTAIVLASRFSQDIKLLFEEPLECTESWNDSQRNRNRIAGFFRDETQALKYVELFRADINDYGEPWIIDSQFAILDALEAIDFRTSGILNTVLSELSGLRNSKLMSPLVGERLNRVIDVLRARGTKSPQSDFYIKAIEEFGAYRKKPKSETINIKKMLDNVMVKIKADSPDEPDIGAPEALFSDIGRREDLIDIYEKGAEYKKNELKLKKALERVRINYDESIRFLSFDVRDNSGGSMPATALDEIGPDGPIHGSPALNVPYIVEDIYEQYPDVSIDGLLKAIANRFDLASIEDLKISYPNVEDEVRKYLAGREVAADTHLLAASRSPQTTLPDAPAAAQPDAGGVAPNGPSPNTPGADKVATSDASQETLSIQGVVPRTWDGLEDFLVHDMSLQSGFPSEKFFRRDNIPASFIELMTIAFPDAIKGGSGILNRVDLGAGKWGGLIAELNRLLGNVFEGKTYGTYADAIVSFANYTNADFLRDHGPKSMRLVTITSAYHLKSMGDNEMMVNDADQIVTDDGLIYLTSDSFSGYISAARLLLAKGYTVTWLADFNDMRWHSSYGYQGALIATRNNTAAIQYINDIDKLSYPAVSVSDMRERLMLYLQGDMMDQCAIIPISRIANETRISEEVLRPLLDELVAANMFKRFGNEYEKMVYSYEFNSWPVVKKSNELLSTDSAIDNTIRLMDEKAMLKEIQNGKKIVIRYDGVRLRENTDVKVDELPPAVQAANQYAELLKAKIRNARLGVDPDEIIQLKDCSSSDKKAQPLFSVTCYESNGKENQAFVDIPGTLNGQQIDVPGMLNAAILSSLIPNGTSMDEIESRYGIFLSFIKKQYKDLTGVSLDLSAVNIWSIILRPTEPVSADELARYYNQVILRLEQAA